MVCRCIYRPSPPLEATDKFFSTRYRDEACMPLCVTEISSMMRTELAQPNPTPKSNTIHPGCPREEKEICRVTKSVLCSRQFVIGSRMPICNERSLTSPTCTTTVSAVTTSSPSSNRHLKQPRFGSHQARGSPFTRNTRSTYTQSRIYLVIL